MKNSNIAEIEEFLSYVDGLEGIVDEESFNSEEHNFVITCKDKRVAISFNAEFINNLQSALAVEIYSLKDFEQEEKGGTFVQMKELTVNEKKELVEQYKGKTIGTVYGPSVVEGLTDDGEHVSLLEFGVEPYCLTLNDFISQLESY